MKRLPLAISILALFIALGGSAYAAHKYIITSRSQIAPKVLKSLSGASGTVGAQGPSGSTGQAGKDGSAGTQGGQGERGTVGEPGMPGNQGVEGEPGSAVAYVKAGSQSEVIAEKGLPLITEPEGTSGIYCVAFPGIDPESSVAMVSTFTTEQEVPHTALVRYTDPSSCPADAFEVLVLNASFAAEPGSFVLAVL